MKLLRIVLAWLILIGIVVLAVIATFAAARANVTMNDTPFYCTSEEIAIILASAMEVNEDGDVTNREDIEEIAEPYIADGTCVYLHPRVKISHIIRVVGFFGTGRKIRLVQFSSDLILSTVPLYGFWPEVDNPPV